MESNNGRSVELSDPGGMYAPTTEKALTCVAVGGGGIA